MSFPYTFQSNFELGDNSEWDSESDTGSKLDFPHYSTLARTPNEPMPYRGAYCMRIQLGDTNDHTLTEGDIDIADAGTAYFRWYLYASDDFTATADDVFSIFELQQAGGTVEQTVGMRITAATNLLEIGVGDGTAPSSYVDFSRGVWHCVELLSTISTGGAGAMTLWLDGQQAIALTSLTQAAAVGQGVLGTQLTLATTTGTLYFDQFVMDASRIGPIRSRWANPVLLTKSGHAFVGPGCIENVTLISGVGTDCVLKVYDTDTASTLDESNIVVHLNNISNSELIDPAGMPVRVDRGAYVSLAGTNPQALLLIGRAVAWGGDGAIRNYGSHRNEMPLVG